MLTNEEARARVAKGAAYLDTKWAEWFEHLCTDRLDMGDPCNCVLGQMTGDYNEAIGKLWPQRRFLTRLIGDTPGDKAEALGFDVADSDFDLERRTDYRRLQDAWIEAIADRRLSQGTDSQKAVDAVGPSAVVVTAGQRA